MPSLRLFAATASCAALLAACASYQPLPLPAQAALHSRITALRHTLPAAGGTAAQNIDLREPLTPRQIGLLAILNAPALRTERGELAQAQAGVTQSATLPNPSINLGYGALLGGAGVQGSWAASIAQDVGALLTYRRRVAAAQAHVEEVNAQLLWQEWQVAQKARLLAVGMYWNGQALARSRQQLAAERALTAAVGSAVARNDATLADLAPLQSAAAARAQALAALEQQQLQNRAELNALLGLEPAVHFAVAQPAAASAPAELAAQIANAPARRPDLVALRLGYRAADDTLRAAILGQFPALVLGGSWAEDTSKVRTFGPTVTFDLPIFNRNQGAIAASRATRLLLREQYQQRLNTARAAALTLAARLQQAQAQLAGARGESATAAAQLQAARTAFDHGNLDARALTDYESTALAREQTVLDLQRTADEAAIGLELELGLGLPATRIAPPDPTEPK